MPLLLLVGGLALLSIWALTMGDYAITAEKAWQTVWAKLWRLDAQTMQAAGISRMDEVIIWNIRLPRLLLTILAGRNLTLTRKIGHMARRTTRDKLLSYLSAQAMQAGGPEFDIPLDRQQLADYLAVDRSAMSTALGKLRDEGVLTFQKNHFHLLQQMEQTD